MPFGFCGARKGLKHLSCRSLAVLFLPGRRVWSLEPWLTRTSCLVLYSLSWGIHIDQGEARSWPSGETGVNPYLLGETNPAPLGSGEAESIPQPSGETEPALKASGETEINPEPLGEAGLCHKGVGWGRPRPSGIGRGGIHPSALGRDRARPKGVGRDGVYPSALGRDRARPKGVGRGGTELLSLEQGMKRRPYASRSFSRSVVIGSTFWGILVLGPRQ